MSAPPALGMGNYRHIFTYSTIGVDSRGNWVIKIRDEERKPVLMNQHQVENHDNLLCFLKEHINALKHHSHGNLRKLHTQFTRALSRWEAQRTACGAGEPVALLAGSRVIYTWEEHVAKPNFRSEHNMYSCVCFALGRYATMKEAELLGQIINFSFRTETHETISSKAETNSNSKEAESSYSIVTVADPLLGSLALRQLRQQDWSQVYWFHHMAIYVLRGLLKNPAGLPLLHKVMQYCLVAI